MFTSTFAASPKTFASAYREVDSVTAITSASPHKLVSLLYGALAKQITVARGALARRDIPEKCRAVSHAVRIVEEGLLAPLDLDAGGEIATNLHDLYEYMVHRLTIANLRNDDAALAECGRLVETLREGWDGIAPAGDVRRPAVAAA